MKKSNFIKLENGNEYFVISEVIKGQDKYYVLVNSENDHDIVIRKDEGQYLVGLDDISELRSVITKLIKDNKNNPEVINLIEGLKDINQ